MDAPFTRVSEELTSTSVNFWRRFSTRRSLAPSSRLLGFGSSSDSRQLSQWISRAAQAVHLSEPLTLKSQRIFRLLPVTISYLPGLRLIELVHTLEAAVYHPSNLLSGWLHLEQGATVMFSTEIEYTKYTGARGEVEALRMRYICMAQASNRY